MKKRDKKIMLMMIVLFYVASMIVIMSDNATSVSAYKNEIEVKPFEIGDIVEDDSSDMIPTITIHKEEVIGERKVTKRDSNKTTPKDKTMVIYLDELSNTTIISKEEYEELNNETEETESLSIEVVEEELDEDIELFSSIPEGCYKVEGRSIEYITQQEFDLLLSIVSAEARGEPYEGQVAVVDVILNRVDCEWYPDTLEGVIKQSGQFESYWAGHYKTAPITESVVKAVLYALENKTMPHNVLFFRSNHYHKWGTPYTQIGGHYFSTSGK